jgi:hypothetical protein
LTWGTQNIFNSRWEALTNNLQRFAAEEAMILLLPFMLIALWKRRHDPLLSGSWLYALGLHIVMTFVFAFPGYRGGLFHSASALMPFCAALGIVGLDDVLAWVAPRRRWKLSQAKWFFGTAMALWAVLFSVFIFMGKVDSFNNASGYFMQVAAQLSDGAVVMINDPSAMYYFTGHPGVVVPNAGPDVIPEIASRYGVQYVVFDNAVTWPLRDLYEGRQQVTFLELIYNNGFQVYRIK